jgi:hypothetical protein
VLFNRHYLYEVQHSHISRISHAKHSLPKTLPPIHPSSQAVSQAETNSRLASFDTNAVSDPLKKEHEAHAGTDIKLNLT